MPYTPQYQYRVTIAHDGGKAVITTWAPDEAAARHQIMEAERCPESAILRASLVPITPADLKYHLSRARGETHFFDHKTMRFFGDTMRNYGVRVGYVVDNITGEGREVWELYRRRPVKHGLNSSAYFDRHTFERVYPLRPETLES